MISFEFHLEKWHEKAQKPLWFLGFPNRYLFRFAMLVAGAGAHQQPLGLRGLSLQRSCNIVGQAHIVYAKHNTVCRKATPFCVLLKTRGFRFAKNDVDLRSNDVVPWRTQTQKIKTIKRWSLFFGCGSRIWTNNLRVMSPTSYRIALSRDICANRGCQIIIHNLL